MLVEQVKEFLANICDDRSIERGVVPHDFSMAGSSFAWMSLLLQFCILNGPPVPGLSESLIVEGSMLVKHSL